MSFSYIKIKLRIFKDLNFTTYKQIFNDALFDISSAVTYKTFQKQTGIISEGIPIYFNITAVRGLHDNKENLER